VRAARVRALHARINLKTLHVSYQWNIRHYDGDHRQSAHSVSLQSWQRAGIVFASRERGPVRGRDEGAQDPP